MKKTSLIILNFASGVFFSFAQGNVVQFGTSEVTNVEQFGTSGVTPVFSQNNVLVQMLTLVKNIADKLIPILVALAVLAFFWFLIRFIWKGSADPAERDKMKWGMLWAILAIFVMVSIWGLIGFISSVTGIQVGGTMHGFKLPGAQ